MTHTHIVHCHHHHVHTPTDQTYTEQQPDTFGRFDVAEEGGWYGVEGGGFGASQEGGLDAYFSDGGHVC